MVVNFENGFNFDCIDVQKEMLTAEVSTYAEVDAIKAGINKTAPEGYTGASYAGITCYEVSDNVRVEIHYSYANSTPQEQLDAVLEQANSDEGLPHKVGYMWKIVDGILMLVKDDEAEGTAENPYVFDEGVNLVPNAYYTYNNVRYVYMGAAVVATTWEACAEMMVEF